MALPVTGLRRSPPYFAAAPASTTAGAVTRARYAGNREDVTASGPEHRALSGLDGEGQAKGQGRNARGEPPRSHLSGGILISVNIEISKP